jgi:hypothetical protein
MEDSKFVMVLLMSDACGHCTNFKNTQLSTLKSQLKSILPNVKLVEISLPTMSSPIPDPYPPSLKQFAKWFPTLLMFSQEAWSTSSIAPHPPLTSGHVFNGKFINGNVEYSPEAQMNVENIIQWAKQRIATSEVHPSKIRFQNEIKNQNETLILPTTFCVKKHFKNNDRRC